MIAHVPVLTTEALQYLRAERGGVYVDCTVGLGGHARALLEAGATRVIGVDRDLQALAIARETLAPWAERVELVHADYRDLDEVLDQLGIRLVDGTLADLGVSSLQFDTPGRGFSFQRDEPLDMRMDTTSGDTAAAARGSCHGAASSPTGFTRTAKSAFPGGSRGRSSPRGGRSRLRQPAGLPRSSDAPCRGVDTCASTRRRARSRRCASG